VTRAAHHADHDLVVDLEPSHDTPPKGAYAIGKRTFSIGEDGLEPAEVLPLSGALDPDELSQGLPVGSDLWWMKSHTDVVVEGRAWAPRGRPIRRSEVLATVGNVSKRIAVFGARHIEWTTSGRPYPSAPEPFESVPLTDDYAYGGFDPRVPIEASGELVEVLAAVSDPPGRYPRNPMGCGYLVLPGRIDGIPLPRLEDPSDLLDAERLITGEPNDWHRQPLPWTLGWQHATSFTRQARLGVTPRLMPEAPAAIAEVERGYLPADWAERCRENAPLDRMFQQEASLGMVFSPLVAGMPITLRGVHPERTEVVFSVPEPPAISIIIDGQSETPPSTLTSVVIEPDELRVSFVYVARTRSLPRTFIPGVHPEIPLSARVDGGPPVHYETPPVIRRPTTRSTR
jgi:hypothetical protein